MKRILILLPTLILSAQLARPQLLKYGVQCGLNYCYYTVTEKSSTIDVTAGSLGFHSGLFIRRDFESFYAGADLNYSSTLGGTVDDGNSSFNVRTGSVNMPVMIGKNFYPGIRLYGGGMPAVYIKHNDNEFRSYLAGGPNTADRENSSLFKNEFVFHMVVGGSVELWKFFIDFRYEHPLDYYIIEDFSTGGSITGIENRHHMYQWVITLGYWFN